MKPLGMELYKVYINHDPGMTMAFLQQGQHRSPMHMNGDNSRKWANGLKSYDSEKIWYMYIRISQISGERLWDHSSSGVVDLDSFTSGLNFGHISS